MADGAKSIYVQIDIRAPIERVWELTQTPQLHRVWDLRFSDIQYLPRPDETLPQRFLYSTRIGMGLDIRGEGETVGRLDGVNGRRASALKFWSDDRKSLIREGSGYWKYVPSPDDDRSVRFLTGYDYSVRFGAAGRWIDRLAFRPLIGWATAWSFDRLRLWIEKDIHPAESMRRSAINLIARLAMALVWLYQGLVPKLMFRSPDEISMLAATGFSGSAGNLARIAIGLIEVAIAATLIAAWRARWPLWFTMVAMPTALAVVAMRSPGFLTAAFNPVALNAALMALAAIALLAGRDVPSASRCVRRPPLGET